MALMAPTQASPAPHPNDFHPDFPNLRNLHCQHWRTTLSLKNTCSPPNGPATTPPGILRPFSVDINKPAAFHTQDSPLREKAEQPADNLTPFSLSQAVESVNPEVIYGSLFPIVKWASSINWSSTMQTACPHSTPLKVPPVRR